ncbi:FAD-binding oxidoreductase [Actinomadura kijaniata]|uniref:FAD/FMN-containing dehydrogenase n=2 Tax=Actinomadura TaxID=1988 RepID=A0A7W3LIV1_ACTNM|nr:FAD-binding oxidoreductase [Actinomadura namibiensis]MBA8948905.1 FAD/FMN-containing dehydrogenase [Actinomadura namibiensis]
MNRRGFLVAAAGTLAAACSDRPPTTAPPARTAPPAASPSRTGPADWNALAEGLEGRLIRPGEAGYDAARRLHIPRFDRIRPAGIAYCGNEQDVAECLTFAARQGLPVAVRSGGHNYAGWSTGTGLVVDVSPLDRVEVERGRAVVGTGTRLIDLYDRLAAAKALVPAGTCPTVGIGGLTLGGGIGPLTRAYGLTCDVLESVRIVTPDGRVRECDARREPDLFWACRGGGGGNFGVATSFAFRTHGAEDLTEFTVRWPWSRAADAVRGWQEWAPAAPEGIWSSLQIEADPASLSITGFALDDPDAELDRFTGKVGGSPDVTTRRLSYLAAMKLTAGCSGRSVGQCHTRGDLPGQRPEGNYPRTEYTAKSHVAHRPLPPDAIDALVDRFSGGGRPGRSVLMDAFGGAMRRTRPGDTAFPHREALFCVQYLADTGDRDWLRGTHDAVGRRLPGAGAYVNYIDPELADWRRAYYGANLDRLARIRATYDPNRLLRFPQAL